MKFVFASDSFKGTLSSGCIAQLLEEAALRAFPSADCVSLLIADGGEGTLDAIAAVSEGELVCVDAHDGLMRPRPSVIFVRGDEACVEAASSCGLALLAENERNPLLTTSYGVGECIRHALDRGCDRIAVGLGGSCTNDGGMGCLRALGIRFLDARGRELEGRGADLAEVAAIDESGLHPRVHTTDFSIMSDVNNPLLGPNGATYVFGPQKGATDEMLRQLEFGMDRYAQAISKTHPEIDFDTAGFGAAGGLGMALSVFLGARMESGIEALLRWTSFDEIIDGADLVITGEGRLDGQSLQGKAIGGVAAHAHEKGVPVALVCGTTTLDDDRLNSLGIAHVIETAEGQDLAYAMAHAEENYARAARHLFERLA